MGKASGSWGIATSWRCKNLFHTEPRVPTVLSVGREITHMHHLIHPIHPIHEFSSRKAPKNCNILPACSCNQILPNPRASACLPMDEAHSCKMPERFWGVRYGSDQNNVLEYVAFFMYLLYSFILDVCNIYTYRSTFIFIHMYAPVNYVFGGFNSKPFFSTRFCCSSCLEQYLETRQLWHLLSTNKVMGSIMCKSSVTDVYSYRMVP